MSVLCERLSSAGSWRFSVGSGRLYVSFGGLSGWISDMGKSGGWVG